MNRDADDEIREIKEDVKELAKKQEDNFRELRERQEADGAAFRAWMAHADAVFAGLHCGEHNAFINGNGKEGAKERLTVLEHGLESVSESLRKHDVAKLHQEVSDLKGTRKTLTGLIVGIVVVLVGAIFTVAFSPRSGASAAVERPPAAVERLQR